MEHLIIYHNLMEHEIIQGFYELKQMLPESSTYKDVYYCLVRALKLSDQTLKGCIFQQMILTQHPILDRLQKNAIADDRDLNCLRHDLKILKQLLNTHVDAIMAAAEDGYQLFHSAYSGDEHPIELQYDRFFEDYDNHDVTGFIRLLKDYGSGQFAMHQAYYLSDDLSIKPIKTFMPLQWEHIYGYQREKEQLLKNTKAFISGLPCHHALLVGASGTGKSSSVKAIIKHFETAGLRLVQMTKNQLKELPLVIKALSQSPFKFILFIDDLSFEVNEDDYKFMKSFIEGGVIGGASNVLFYITSNRRHLIKEIRSERENDIHLNDFIQEMTSLSDRFGLTLFYQAPEQTLYYEMVLKMLGNQVHDQNQEQLLLEAKRWSLRHGGMSGRVAEQFVKHYMMEQQMKS